MTWNCLPSPVKVGTLYNRSSNKYELSIEPGFSNDRFKHVPELLETPELEVMLQL